MKLNFLFRSATAKIIAINVAIFILFTIISLFISPEKLINFLALQPISIINGQKLWTILTSMFIHASFFHLFVNMFSLYFIGNFVEKIIGKKRFIIFYILSGIFAGIFWAILSGYFAEFHPILSNILGSPYIPGVGASGALFGLVGILAVLTPKSKVYLIAGPLIAIILESIIAAIFNQNGLSDIAPYSSIMSLLSIVLTIYFMIAIFSMFSFDPKFRKIALPIELSMWVLPIIAIIPLIIVSIFIDLPIGNMAHLGGLIVGLTYAYYLRKKYPKRTKMLSRMFR